MRQVTWIKKQYVYIILAITLVITWAISQCVTFSLTPEGLRTLAVVEATVIGVLCGLVATIAALIVRTATSQRQFYQSILANISQWFKNWLNTHTAIPGLNNDKVKRLLYLLDRHSTMPAASDEEVFELTTKVLTPLPKKWFKLLSKTPEQISLQKEEIEEFDDQVEQIGATIGQIKASKDRLGVAKALGDMLWLLVGTLMLALIVIVLASIPDASVSGFIGKNTAPIAVTLIEIMIILIFGIIFVIAKYLRAEYTEATRIVES